MEAALRRVPEGFLSTGLPDSSVPLGAFPSFVPRYVSSLVFCDLITAVLLFSQFAVLRAWSLLVLAGGYLLVFPGIFAP